MDAAKNAGSKPELILFDVYKTLLDMTEVERKVNNLMHSKRGYAVWFELFMEYCFVDNCTIQFNDFTSIAKATMQMAARAFDVEISGQNIESVLALLKHLSLNEGVQKGLSLLSNQNYRIAALTNSPEHTVRERMERTGLISYFEMVLSAEHVKKYKPSIEVYEWAAKKLDVNPGDILLVSAHDWDIMGATNAGMQTAYIKNNSQIIYPLASPPTFIIKDLNDLAEQLKMFSDSATFQD